jgi:hypothetical protein
MFRQLVEKNSDAEEAAGDGTREAAAHAGEAYEYHAFLQTDGPDMCDLFSSGCGNARNAAFHRVLRLRPESGKLGWFGEHVIF